MAEESIFKLSIAIVRCLRKKKSIEYEWYLLKNRLRGLPWGIFSLRLWEMLVVTYGPQAFFLFLILFAPELGDYPKHRNIILSVLFVCAVYSWGYCRGQGYFHDDD